MTPDQDSGDADEAIEQAADAAEAAGEDVTSNQRQFAFRYLTVLFIVLGGAAVAGFHWDLLRVGTVDVGWIAEYLVLALALAFAVFTIAMVFVALPGSILGGLIRVFGGVYQAYQEDDQ